MSKHQGGREQIRQAIQWAREAGLETMGFFSIGHPGETEKTLAETTAFLLSLDLDFIQVSPIFMLPGSPLYKEFVEQTGRDLWREHTLNPTQLKELPLVDCSLTTTELKGHALAVYRAFYFRPRQILRTMRRFRDSGNASHALRAARSLVLKPPGIDRA
jgi:radical SAM superfamily enzyme YgiQ (UPF0313 family)